MVVRKAEPQRPAPVVQKPAPRVPAPPPPRVARPSRDEMSAGAGRALRERATRSLGSTGLRDAPAASSLMTEVANDSQVNCLDAAYDYLKTLPPNRQAAADVIFLDDVRAGAEGTDGHVLVREGNRFFDPSTGAWHDSLKRFDPAGNYAPAGVLPARQLTQILDAPVGSPERAAALANVPPALTKMMVADTDLPSLAGLTTAAVAAKGQTAELDQQLAREIALYGPAMTDSQKQQFVEAFQAEHVEYSELRAQQDDLATYLQDNPDLARQAATDPQVASTLATAAEALAGTEHNDVVLEYLRDPALMTAITNVQGADWVQSELLTPAVGTMATETLLAAGSDRAAASAALDEVNALLATVGTVPGLAEQVTQSAQMFTQLRGAYSAATDANDLMRRLAEVNRSVEGMELGGLAKVGVGLTFVAGVALMADGALSGDGQRAFEGLMQMGQNADAVQYGLELLAKAMPSLGRAAGTAAKIAPIISTVANALTFLDQVGRLDSDSSRFQAASSFAQAAGGALMLTGVGVVPGAVITAVGVALGVVGSILEGNESAATNQRFDAEAQALLAGLNPPLTPAVISAMAAMGPEASSALTRQLAMTPDGWTTLAAQQPGLMSALAGDGQGIISRFDALGLTSADAIARFAQLQLGADAGLAKDFFEALATSHGTDRAAVLQWLFEATSGSGAASTQRSGLAPSVRPAVVADPYQDLLQRVLTYANGG